jgi:serine/threonine protein kinase
MMDTADRAEAAEKTKVLTDAFKPAAPEVVDFTLLDVLGTLGKGSFGFVQLVRHRKTKKTYALKSVVSIHFFFRSLAFVAFICVRLHFVASKR